jgi:hypothetical protein
MLMFLGNIIKEKRTNRIHSDENRIIRPIVELDEFNKFVKGVGELLM